MLRLACILTLTLGLAQTTDTEMFLDLTTLEVRQMEKAKTVGCGGVSGGVYISGQPYRPPQLTLELKIDWLSENCFKVGDEVVADVRLTNTGDKPVLLPWNPDSDIVYGKDCKDFAKLVPPHTMLGSVALKVVDTEGKANFVAGHEFFGLRDDPATYRILAPHQSARIRVSGKLNLPRASVKSSSSGTTNHFKAIAEFDLTDTSVLNPFPTVLCTDPRDVTVTGSVGSQ